MKTLLRAGYELPSLRCTALRPSAERKRLTALAIRWKGRNDDNRIRFGRAA